MIPERCEHIYQVIHQHARLPNKNLRKWAFDKDSCWLYFDSYYLPNHKEALFMNLSDFLKDKDYKGFVIKRAPDTLSVELMILEFKA
jgi:hypothetical protein